MDAKWFQDLMAVFEKLNEAITSYNKECFEQGSLALQKQELKIVGQVALLLNDLPFPLAATTDLDLVKNPDYSLAKKLEELLLEIGLSLEKDSSLIWMPENTTYHTLCEFSYLKVFYADHTDVMKSKKKFHREKDKRLIEMYERIFDNKK